MGAKMSAKKKWLDDKEAFAKVDTVSNTSAGTSLTLRA